MLAAPAPFIVGVGRSGTTLLRLMLDSHPELAIPAETHFLPRLISLQNASMVEAMEILTGAETWPNMAITAADLQSEFDRIDTFSATEAARSFYRLYARQHGKTRWGDKTPTYRILIGDIGRFLPEARFIHMIRDGRDVSLSYRGLWFGPGDDIAEQAAFWVRQISLARAQAVLPGTYLEVRYEDLVSAPQTTLATVCAFLNLDFDLSMLNYHVSAAERMSEHRQAFGRPGEPPPPLDCFLAIHDHTGQPPDPNRIGRWRTEMPAADLRRYEEIAGPLLEALGYETARQR